MILTYFWMKRNFFLLWKGSVLNLEKKFELSLDIHISFPVVPNFSVSRQLARWSSILSKSRLLLEEERQTTYCTFIFPHFIQSVLMCWMLVDVTSVMFSTQTHSHLSTHAKHAFLQALPSCSQLGRSTFATGLVYQEQRVLVTKTLPQLYNT